MKSLKPIPMDESHDEKEWLFNYGELLTIKRVIEWIITEGKPTSIDSMKELISIYNKIEEL